MSLLPPLLHLETFLLLRTQHIVDHVKNMDAQVIFKTLLEVCPCTLLMVMAYANLKVNCLLGGVNGDSVLDGNNTILGINTFWSAQLPVSTLASILL